MIGTVATSDTGVKSLTGSQDSLAKNAGAVANEVGAMYSVWPSGAARATCSAAMLPLAPALFSTTMGWPSACESLSPSARAARSVEPPGGKPTSMRIGLLGYWAQAAEAKNARNSKASRFMARSPSVGS